VAALAAFPEMYRMAPKEIRSGQELAVDLSATPGERAREHAKRVLFAAPGTLAYGWIAAFIYVRLRNSRIAARVLADAELERSQARQRLRVQIELRVHPDLGHGGALQASPQYYYKWIAQRCAGAPPRKGCFETKAVPINNRYQRDLPRV
jgi:hypothetical protein